MKTMHLGPVGIILAVLIAMMATVTTAGAQTSANVAATQGQVTFAKDVAPILQQKCQECHQPNSIAPMSLITYQEVRPWARAIKERVAARQMPPWHIDRSVGVQKFKNDMSLTDQQVNTSIAWVDDGALQNDPDAVNKGTANGPIRDADDLVNRRPQLMEWAIGKGYDLFRPGAGKLILPGEKISWDQHIHAVGEEIKAGSEIGIWFYKN